MAQVTFTLQSNETHNLMPPPYHTKLAGNRERRWHVLASSQNRVQPILGKTWANIKAKGLGLSGFDRISHFCI
jgi:hypothetical protein